MVVTSTTAETAKQLQQLLKPLREERADAARLDELRRIFSQQGDLSPSKNASPAVQKWRAYLRKQLAVFTDQLCERMKNRKTAIRTFWGIIAAVPSYTPNQHHPFVSQALLSKWFQHLPSSLDDKDVRTMVQSEFLHPYVDVYYYSYVTIAHLAQQQYQYGEDATISGDLLFDILNMLPRVKSQTELDEGTYLFPPPTSGTPEEDDESDNDEEDDDNDNDENDSEDDDDDDDDDASSSESDNDNQRPAKKLKPAPKKMFQYQQLRAHRRAMSRAWLAVLKLQLSTASLKRALQILPTQVLPHVPNPLRFADFFVQAFGTSSDSMDTASSIVSILSLDGLFLLMLEYGLEYPSFYKSLYRLITPTLFHVKHRVRFFQLLSRSLIRNEMLPAHIVAAFIKKLLRSCVTSAPPASCLYCLALTSNLLRKHEECAGLIHKSSDSVESYSLDTDPFDATTNDPTVANALSSSLWELQVLEHHYHPAVATLAQSVGKEDPLTTPMHDLDSTFLLFTYKSLMDQERKRKKNKKVPLAFSKPSGLFVKGDVFDGILKTV